jgi:hypothetical protein
MIGWSILIFRWQWPMRISANYSCETGQAVLTPGSKFLTRKWEGWGAPIPEYPSRLTLLQVWHGVRVEGAQEGTSLCGHWVSQELSCGAEVSEAWGSLCDPPMRWERAMFEFMFSSFGDACKNYRTHQNSTLVFLLFLTVFLFLKLFETGCSCVTHRELRM